MHLRNILISRNISRNSTQNYLVKIQYFDSKEPSQNNKIKAVNEWSESTKVIDYLNHIRLDELRNAQKKSLEVWRA